MRKPQSSTLMRRLNVLSILMAAILGACGSPPAGSAPNGAQAGALSLPSTNVVDLTHAFNDETIYWPTEDGFRRIVTSDGLTDRGYYYNAGRFYSAEHGGTHLDAPLHFADGGHAVDDIPLDRLMGPAVVIDVAGHASANPDYRVASEDIRTWEAEHRPIPDGAIVLFRTGFGRFWPDAESYMGTTATGPAAASELHFPGLHPEAAAWLLENRSVKALGIDTPSIDYGPSQTFDTHQVLFEANVPVFENVANLDQVPEEGAVVIALPMKIDGGSGAPLRIVAFVP